ncbi:ABC transporter substrate-binding protein [Streptomyces tubbatahanensis]|uniref:ABC transporter substrate-binding protein n=1 Tax=Streptomyces tubbatahanensis TaxID=2923272 RepID=A0ABY3XWV6_9ACTN|nr:ABC transporter substrate-binding protein [Streptomyces tubbatahanensis]UNS98897.1 ABC transporter substrate-binding protein [Streptomyces tubbatahanensis]
MTASRPVTAGTTVRGAARRARIVPVALAVSGALLLAGCGDQTDGAQSGGSSGGKAELSGKLPDKIRNAGVIKVGTDAAYKPMEYKEGADIVGLDVDIAEAMGEKLGVRFQFTNGTFDGLITSMQTGRFDMIMSAMTDTKERQKGLDDDGKEAGKGVDFVDYLSAGSSILVRKGNPEKIDSVDQMCGEKVATQRGTTSHEILKAQTEKCVEDGEKKIDVEAYNTDDEARVRLKTGGVVADISDFPVAANAAKSSGDFEVVGKQMQSAPYGIAVSKDNRQLRDALQAAMKAIIEDGSYQRALEKWGVQDGGVKKVTVNAGT